MVLAEADEIEAERLGEGAQLDELAVARGGGPAHAADRIGEVVAQDQQAAPHQGASPLAAKKRQISSAARMSWLVGPSRRGSPSCGCGALWPPFRIA